MGIHEFDVLASLIGFLGGGAFLLIGLRMFLTHRARRLSGEGTSELIDAMGGLRDEVSALRDQMVDLHERVDFAERLLAQQRAGTNGPDRQLGR
jgi:hypothetical protein